MTLLDELQALGVSFVSLDEGIDCTTPAGRLQLHVLAALAEFERARILIASWRAWSGPGSRGSAWAGPFADVPVELLSAVEGLPLNDAAPPLGVSRSTLKRWRKRVAAGYDATVTRAISVRGDGPCEESR